jgi:hypothetical protein
MIFFTLKLKYYFPDFLNHSFCKDCDSLEKKNESCSFYILRSDEHTHHNFLDFMQQSKLVSYFDTIFSKHMLNFPD